MSRGGYRASAFPWRQVAPENRGRIVRERLVERDTAALVALINHHRPTALAPTTAATYERAIGRWILSAHSLHRASGTAELLTPASLPALEARHAEFHWRLAPSSANVERSAIRSLYRALRQYGVTTAVPYLDWRAPSA